MIHDYPIKNNIVLFLNGPLSNWYGAFKGQDSKFKMAFPTRPDDYLLRSREITFNCAEQAMMFFKAEKFEDYETADKILATKNPQEQKDLGRAVKNYKDEVWNQFRFKYVTDIVTAKFEQHEKLRDFLCIDLANYILAEASSQDKIWGIGLNAQNPLSWDVKTWNGRNLLGKALMAARADLSQIYA